MKVGGFDSEHSVELVQSDRQLLDGGLAANLEGDRDGRNASDRSSLDLLGDHPVYRQSQARALGDDLAQDAPAILVDDTQTEAEVAGRGKARGEQRIYKDDDEVRSRYHQRQQD